MKVQFRHKCLNLIWPTSAWRHLRFCIILFGCLPFKWTVRMNVLECVRNVRILERLIGVVQWILIKNYILRQLNSWDKLPLWKKSYQKFSPQIIHWSNILFLTTKCGGKLNSHGLHAFEYIFFLVQGIYDFFYLKGRRIMTKGWCWQKRFLNSRRSLVQKMINSWEKCVLIKKFPIRIKSRFFESQLKLLISLKILGRILQFNFLDNLEIPTNY